MFTEYERELNKTFLAIYDTVQRVEERILKDSKFDLSISELDILETIGNFKNKGCSISEIAREKLITLPTVTVAIKKLEAKNYVEKVRSEDDGRMVKIMLSPAGHKADAVHRYFHEQMVRSFLQNISEDNRPIILDALKNLNAYLLHSLKK